MSSGFFLDDTHTPLETQTRVWIICQVPSGSDVSESFLSEWLSLTIL